MSMKILIVITLMYISVECIISNDFYIMHEINQVTIKKVFGKAVPITSIKTVLRKKIMEICTANYFEGSLSS